MASSRCMSSPHPYHGQRPKCRSVATCTKLEIARSPNGFISWLTVDNDTDFSLYEITSFCQQRYSPPTFDIVVVNLDAGLVRFARRVRASNLALKPIPRDGTHTMRAVYRMTGFEQTAFGTDLA